VEELLKAFLFLFFVVFLCATTVMVFLIVSTILHELWHVIAAKILRGKVSNITWFDFQSFLRLFESPEGSVDAGEVYVSLPPDKVRFDWVVDLAGGLGAGLTFVVAGALILALTIKDPFSVFPVIGGVIISMGIPQFVSGIQECRNKKIYMGLE